MNRRRLATALLVAVMVGSVLSPVASAADEEEPNDDCNDPGVKPLDDDNTGAVPDGDDRDFWAQQMYRTVRYTFDLSWVGLGAGMDFSLALHGDDCSLISAETFYDENFAKLRWDSRENGQRYVQLYKFDGPSNGYTLDRALSQDDASSDRDAGDTRFDAHDLSSPGTYGAALLSGDVDWYRINPQVGRQVTVTLQPDCGGDRDFDVALFGPFGNRVDRSGNWGCTHDTVSCVSATGLPVTVRVRRASGLGGYDLSYGFSTGSSAPCTDLV